MLILGQHDDAGMGLSVALTAANLGACVTNHVEVTQLVKDGLGDEGQIAGCKVRDTLNGEEFEVKGSVVVNATGPFTG